MSRLPFELMLALRYLRPKRTFVSFITLISVAGVMLGVAVLIIVISVMTGFDRQLREKILGFNAHLRVFKVQGPMINHEDVIAKVRQHARVRAVAPFVLGKVLVESQPQTGETPAMDAPILRGTDPDLERKISTLHTNLVDGEFNLGGNGLVVGAEFARSLRLRVGDRLAVYSPSNLKKMRETRGKDREVAILPEDYVVRGIFDVGYFEYNAMIVVTSLGNAQDLYELGEAVHGLQINLDDPHAAAEAKGQLQRVLGDGFEIRSWDEDNSTILNALLVEKSVMFYLLFFIVLVAAFGITSALITFVVQKTREIGVLKALGAADRQVLALFLAQSAFVGSVGVTLGLSLGLLAIHYRNEFLLFMRNATGFELFPAKIYNFNLLPAIVDPRDIVIICGGSLLICIFAGLLPAWNASRLRPVEALRHE
ncbi:MAG: FtsX-like permease family protein [Verrucomicrobia bacterium]|nr:FtsX-like permease family protein [Verrucomicrobiota bacterium]